MGFLGGVINGLKTIGGAVLKGVAMFAKSPFGKILMQVGLNAILPGIGGLVGKAISSIGGKILGGLASAAASKFATSTIGGFAMKFLTQATDYLTKAGLGAIEGFVRNTCDTSDLATLAKELMRARQTKMDATTEQIADLNLQALFAKQAGALFAA